MANPQLTVEISAKIDGLRDAFNKAVKEIKGLDANTKKSLSSIDNGFERLANDIDKSMSKAAASTSKASSTITKNLATAANATAKAGQGISVGSNQAANSLQNLGRVAQDAPFGFIGIQNNLNPLLESFQRLRAESGSNSAAFKALGQSLIGPAGLGLALSLVSSGVLLYQQYQQRANKTAENAKKVTEDYIATLETLRGVNLRGTENAQKELTDLRLLYNAYQNANLPLTARKEAYSELQKQYPSYFGNIAFEKEATNKTTTAYNELSNAIIATARARAASDKITKNETRKLENEQKQIDLQKEQIKLRAQQAKIANAAVEQISTSTREGTGLAAATRSNSIQGKINETIKATNALKTDTNLLDAENARLVGYVNEQLAKGAKIIGGFGGGGAVAKTKDIFKEGVSKLLIADPTIRIGVDLDTSALKVKFKELAPIVDESLAQLRYQFDVTDDQIKSFIENTGTNAANYLKVLQDYNNGLSQSISSGAVSTLAGLGSAIGEAFANGANVVQAAAGSILGSIGSILVKFGELTLAAGVAATALGKALSQPLNPASAALAIGAGVALIAIGSAVGAFSKNLGSGSGGSGGSSVKPIRGFATGGQNISGGLAVVGEHGREIINVPNGSDILPTPQTQRILGGNNGGNVNIIPEIGFSMDQFVIKFRQAERRLGRSN